MPDLHLCGGCGGERDVGQEVAERGIVCLVEGCEPAVEEVAGRCIRDEAYLIAVAGQANEDCRMNRADMVALTGGSGSVGGIAEHDGVDFCGVIVVVARLGRV